MKKRREGGGKGSLRVIVVLRNVNVRVQVSESEETLIVASDEELVYNHQVIQTLC